MQLLGEYLHRLMGLFRCGARVQMKTPGDAAGAEARGNGINQATLLAHLDKEARGHAPTKYFAEELRGVVVGITKGHVGRGQADMLLLPLVVLDDDAIAEPGAFGSGWLALARPSAKERFQTAHQVVPIEVPGNGKHGVAGAVEALPI